ncbi:hypothetical protein PQY77_05160, partial [Candidatus Pelagibacter sp.]|nr:hypothetical protein [Candidatus Pelagibacter sp.]MDC6483570.1 hypothetical protein [Candidatus Pelagibacter sp.]
MKNYFLKFFFLIIAVFVTFIIFLSTKGLETDNFNNQIKNVIHKSNNSLNVELKKIKLKLNPVNFNINAKTVGAKISYKGTSLPLEYIKVRIPVLSLIKKRITSSKLEISTRSILLRDLVGLIRSISNKPELILLEKSIKKGQAIINIDLNLDDNGKIKQDFQVNAILKDAKVGLFKKYNFEKINFLLNANNNIFNFKDLSFTSNESDFNLENLKIIKEKNNYFVEGDIQNKNSVLNNELLKLFNINFNNIEISNTNYESKNTFSFKINNKFKIKNMAIDSDIYIYNLDYKKPAFFNDYLQNDQDTFQIKDHKVKLIFKKDNLAIDGFGLIKIENKFDDIRYNVNLNNNNINLTSSLNLSELKLKLNKQEYLKSIFPKLDKVIRLKDQQIEIDYNNNDLNIKGEGEIKFSNEFEQINFNILKTKNEYKFITKIDLEKTLLNIDFLNFKKKDKLKTRIDI